MMAVESYSAFLCFSLLPALLVCVLVPTVVLLRRARGLRFPPGPSALPLIGHLHRLGANPHQSLHDLSRTYGPLMLLRFGSTPVVVASSAATARLFLQTHDSIFAWRPRSAVPMQLHSCSDMVFSQPGPYWRLVRQICSTDLLGAKRLKSFRPMVAEEMRAMLRSIAADAPQSTHLRPKLYAAASNIIARMALGKRLEEVATHSQAEQSHNLVDILLEAVHLLGVFNVGDYVPWLAWADLQGCARKSKAVSQKMQRVWREIMDARRSSRSQQSSAAGPTEDSDFLDVLLSASEREDVEITDTHIMGILFDMFAGGIDTSIVIVEWALAELLSHPTILKKVQNEIDTMVGNSRLVREADIQNLPYLQVVVKETMRLHPAIPLLVPHMASQQCKIVEFDIPSNTHVYVNVWAIGRDPSAWNKPLEFCPDRFLNSRVDFRGQHFEFLPFGSGRRVCPGMLLGIDTVHIMLASLLQVFDWTIEGKITMTEKFGLVMALATPIVAKASLRMPYLLEN